MKKVFLFLCIVLSCQPEEEIKITPLKADQKKILVDFRTSLNYILEHEGYYANIENDRGGETYAGITRRWNPNWYGWRYIDQYKKKGPIKWKTHIPELDHWVLDYYLDIWHDEGFFKLKDQNVANQVLDFRVNATIGVIIIQRTLIEMGYKVNITNRIDETTIEALNSVDSCRFLFLLGINRAVFYTKTAYNNETQKQFLTHWILRTKKLTN